MIRRTVQHTIVYISAFKISTCFYLSNQHSNHTSTAFLFCPEAIYTLRYRHYVCISCEHGQMQFTRTHKCISDVHSETHPLCAIAVAFQACTHNYASYMCSAPNMHLIEIQLSECTFQLQPNPRGLKNSASRTTKDWF